MNNLKSHNIGMGDSPYDIGLNPPPKSKPQKRVGVDFPLNFTPVHLMVYQNRPELIIPSEALRHCGFDVVDNHGNTPLHIACSLGRLECVEVLVSKHSSVLVHNAFGEIPLFCALRSQNSDFDASSKISKILLEKCGKEMLAATDMRGYTVLHYAVFMNNTSFLDYILSLCCVDEFINNTFNEGNSTPLHIAAKFGLLQSAQWLLDHNADVTLENEMGETALIVAIKNRQQEISKVLLKTSPLDVPDNYGQTVLHHAAAVGDLDLCKTIIEMCPKLVNTGDCQSNFPFHCAVKANSKEVMEYFYSNILCLERGNSQGMTPLMIAVSLGCEQSMCFLKERGAKMDQRTMRGTTLFLSGVVHGEIGILEKISGIEEKDKMGNSVFHYAVQSGRIKIVEWLFKQKKELLEEKNDSGETPLHIGSLRGDLQMVKHLITVCQHHVDLRNNEGRTPLHYAVMGGNMECVKYLIENNRACGYEDKHRMNVIHLCCARGTVNLLEYLCESYKELINKRDACGRTPLHIAVIMNDALSVEILKRHGADLVMKDIRGMNVKQSATNRGFLHCLDILNGTKKSEWVVINKVESLGELVNVENSHMLSLHKGEIISVVWVYNEWGIGINERGESGLFKMEFCKSKEMSTIELEKMKGMLKKQKEVRKIIEKKNRSLSVAVPPPLNPIEEKVKTHSPRIEIPMEQDTNQHNLRNEQSVW
ncbi:ankyrin repeat-containing protein, putative [Entamoeba invadens IP1]|uniref:Ankyrin repeat-containing protein, putative n=1 Tax=Entamoeba invadens IP1 TaxID=370355 RepID=A0A0A1UE95_ENTIV|nr:ankyrin repeat-containing protein, putative [Entamoeba invadens IP1]ELP94808.1 ankyrin repeat-containing protein, putative [Entamoeba invadens IP1]|eukprot:XP_004261579.1 ankyrin repeat-containing protein, putative [Entamoeba invadens IP1]